MNKEEKRENKWLKTHKIDTGPQHLHSKRAMLRKFGANAKQLKGVLDKVSAAAHKELRLDKEEKSMQVNWQSSLKPLLKGPNPRQKRLSTLLRRKRNGLTAG